MNLEINHGHVYHIVYNSIAYKSVHRCILQKNHTCKLRRRRLFFRPFCCCTSDRVAFSVFSVLLRCYRVLLFLSFGKSLLSHYNLVKILVS